MKFFRFTAGYQPHGNKVWYPVSGITLIDSRCYPESGHAVHFTDNLGYNVRGFVTPETYRKLVGLDE